MRNISFIFIYYYLFIIIIVIINTWSSQSIKIGKSDLIDIDCIDQSVEIDDTRFVYRFILILPIYIGRYISVHPKMKLISWQQ